MAFPAYLMFINLDKIGTAVTNVILIDVQVVGSKIFLPISLKIESSLKLFKQFASNPKAHDAMTSVVYLLLN